MGTSLWEQHLDFRDARPPHQIRAGLERDLSAVFRLDAPGQAPPSLVYRANVNQNGVTFQFTLRFVAALGALHCYSLHVQATWPPAAKPESEAYYRSSCPSWFKFWTRDFQTAPPPPPPLLLPMPDDPHFLQIAAEAANAESHLVDVPAIQQAIVAAMRQGAGFATSHKEGGTRISILRLERDRPGDPLRFVRSNYGESNDEEIYDSESSFFAFLRQFYDWEISRAVYPAKLPDFDAWLLIFRKLRH